MISLFILIMEVVLLSITQKIGISDRPAWAMVLMILLFSIAYIFDVQYNERLGKVRQPLIQGYVVRVFFVFFDIYGRRIMLLPNSGADTEMFYSGALVVAAGGESRRGAFVYAMAYLFKNLGLSRVYAQFLLMLCSIIALHVGYRIMCVCEIDEETRYRAMIILCLLPNFAILSSIFARESIVTMFVTISLFFFVMWMENKGTLFLFFAIVSVFVAMRFHSGAIAVFIGYLIVVLIYNNKMGKVFFNIFNIFVSLLILFVGVFIITSNSELFIGKFLKIDSIGDIANTNAAGGSSYAQFVGNSNNPINILIYTLPRIVFFLFSPMPFQWRGLSDIIAFFFSSMFYIVVLYNTIKYLKDSNDTNCNIVKMLFIVALCTMFVFAWGVSNTGTATRHRDKMVILYGVLYALTTATPKKMLNSSGNELRNIKCKYIR